MAAKQFGFAPYIDGSCRREPDFESAYPSITALCRAGKFAPKLQPGDIIVYITSQGVYPPHKEPHWRLVSILQIRHRFATHQEAADWYLSHNLPLPSNCMVDGNGPLPFEQTNQQFPTALVLAADASDELKIRRWDQAYKMRANKHPVFLACKPEYLDLNNPAILSREKLTEVFGKIPGTQSAKQISPDQLDQLRSLVDQR